MPGGGALSRGSASTTRPRRDLTAFNDVYPTLYNGAGAQDAYTQTDVSLRYDVAEG